MTDEKENKIILCEVCGRSVKEYDISWSCKKNHDWRAKWRKDKESKKYKKYLKKRKISQSAAQRKRLEKLNKKPPKEYVNRNKKQGAWKPRYE